MISRYLPSDSKMGVGYQVHALANAMVARGHTVTVFSQSPKPDGARYTLAQVPVHPPLRALRASWYLRSIDWSRFDVLHAHGDDWFLWNKGVPPHVRTIHGSCLAEAVNIRGIKNKFYMLFLACLETLSCVVADKTVAVSSNTCRSYPWLKTVIPNGVDVAAYAALRFNDQRSMSNDQKLGGDGGGTTKTQRHEGRGEGEGALRRNDQKSTNNEQRTRNNTTKEFGVRSEKLEEGDGGGFTAKTQRHEEGADDPQIDDATKKLEVRSEELEERDDDGGGTTEVGEVPETKNTDNTDNTECTDNTEANSQLLSRRAGTSSSPSQPSNSCGKAASPTILFVGTYGNRKRGKLLMDVFARDVLPRLPEAQLWMVCSDAPAAAGVCVLGRISQAELVERYQRAWVFCLPSTYEGFGIPYIEAMAAGTAVVASPNVGAVEVTRNGQDGMIATDDKLGEALLQVLTDEVLRHKLEKAGRERVKEFDLNRVCEKYEEIYAAVAAV